jgi:hypothetical protein
MKEKKKGNQKERKTNLNESTREEAQKETRNRKQEE